MERTVVLVKPDGVKRGLVGEVLQRFERMSLKIVALKMMWASQNHLGEHYKNNNQYLKTLGEKTLATYKEYGKDAGEDLGTKDPLELGKMVRKWTIDYVGSGPVVAILLEGRHAMENVKSITGPTMPVKAPPGTIRGDLATDSAAYANAEKRGVENIVHVSGNKEEAKFEEKLWFHENEIYSYKRGDEV
ncbi:MAG: Nucleoside diphosphate kinase [Candidatus Woesebacteria bacterium GW2011_GWA1_45_8]|uniref:nucleoside-diphosphate kinase n=1 Tax=Candidatus Woesebacteria bacterium GW2011_GWA1_45_8 TaxID=1618559 RepID=A0A0G1Q3G4_9BACT|nr:MAG: Nucleoside diphosphate kinase [Candidatus Woesebacteria bacterium GW2011_GWA1_45_8]